MRTNPLGLKTVGDFVERAVGDDMHAKRVLSLTNVTMGVIHAATLGVTTIGRALAQARGLDPKSAVKQVDRLLSNKGVNAWELFASWVPMVVAKRTELVVALDWTDFDDDDHATICLYLLTKHGRATKRLLLHSDNAIFKIVEVRFYTTPAGNSPVEKYLEALAPRVELDVARARMKEVLHGR